jgi:hypothetical protein
MAVTLLNNVVATGASVAYSCGNADQNLVEIYSTAGAAGSTVTVESSVDGTNWITELSVAAPTASPVASTQRVYVPASNFLRANVTVWAVGNIFAKLQSWRQGKATN